MQISFYYDVARKEAWKRKATHQGYNSINKYLYDLILEARSYRHQASSPRLAR